MRRTTLVALCLLTASLGAQTPGLSEAEILKLPLEWRAKLAPCALVERVGPQVELRCEDKALRRVTVNSETGQILKVQTTRAYLRSMLLAGLGAAATAAALALFGALGGGN